MAIVIHNVFRDLLEAIDLFIYLKHTKNEQNDRTSADFDGSSISRMNASLMHLRKELHSCSLDDMSGIKQDDVLNQIPEVFYKRFEDPDNHSYSILEEIPFYTEAVSIHDMSEESFLKTILNISLAHQKTGSKKPLDHFEVIYQHDNIKLIWTIIEGMDIAESDQANLFWFLTKLPEWFSSLQSLISQLEEEVKQLASVFEKEKMQWGVDCRERQAFIHQELIQQVKPSQLINTFNLYPRLIAYRAAVMRQMPHPNEAYIGIGIGFFEYRAQLQSSHQNNSLLMDVLKNMSDASRWKILILLKQREHYVGELASELQLTPSTVSHHLSCMSEIGLVHSGYREGKNYYYYDAEQMKRYMTELESVWL